MTVQQEMFIALATQFLKAETPRNDDREFVQEMTNLLERSRPETLRWLATQIAKVGP